jgi:hypothetical protein
MRIEKMQCDGCKKEYPLGTTAFKIRFINSNTDKRLISPTFESESAKQSIPLDNSLDFCDVPCLQLYLEELKTPPEEPK